MTSDLVFQYPISPDHIEVDISLVLCIEPRFTNPIGRNDRSTADAFMRSKNWKCVYLPQAGGAKVLASDDPAHKAEKDAFLARIDQEIGLHHPKRLGASVHLDCGAYGYSKAFGDMEKERTTVLHDLEKAGALLRERFGPRVGAFVFYLFTFEGVEEVRF